MANTFNEGIRLKEAFLSKISAIRISRPVTNFELFTQESSVRNNHVGGGEEEEVGGGNDHPPVRQRPPDRSKTPSRCHVETDGQTR